jgi:hypothetical protein
MPSIHQEMSKQLQIQSLKERVVHTRAIGKPTDVKIKKQLRT